jgi:hypothetical protein
MGFDLQGLSLVTPQFTSSGRSLPHGWSRAEAVGQHAPPVRLSDVHHPALAAGDSAGQQQKHQRRQPGPRRATTTLH